MGGWARSERQQNRSRARKESQRRGTLKQEGYADTANQMNVFREQVPIDEISRNITQGYQSAADKMAGLYGDGLYSGAGKNISDTYRGQETKARGDVAPWREAGIRALGTLEGKIATGPGEFEADPGYQFRQEQGNRAVDSSAAARGGALSGRAVKEAARFNQGLASQEYGKFVDRFHKSLQPLQQMSGQGLAAGGTMGGYSMTAAPGIAEGYRYGAEGQAEALRFGAQGIERGEMARANALTSAYSGAVQGAENERGRVSARLSEDRTLNEATKLRKAAAMERRRKSMNAYAAYSPAAAGTVGQRVAQIPYY